MASPDHPAGSDLTPGPDAPPTHAPPTVVSDDEAYTAVAAAVLDNDSPVEAPPALVAEIDRILAGIDPSRSRVSADEVRDWLLDLRSVAAH